MVAQFLDLACARLNIACPNGPYDRDALCAIAQDVMPTLSGRRSNGHGDAISAADVAGAVSGSPR